MGKPHQKHAKLARPCYGEFARNEWAILGTPCGEIKKLAQIISESLSNKFKIAYVDADHKSADDHSNLTGSSLAFGNHAEYIDKIDFHRYDTKSELSNVDRRLIFNELDLVIVNGNHFKAKVQIAVIDPKKPLEKKLDKLTNVGLILLQNEVDAIPDYVQNHVEEIDKIPVLSIANTAAICQFIETKMANNLPKINGLVLAGGRSVRMQKDKTIIHYHGSAQREHMLNLLSAFVNEAYFSIREDQKDGFSGHQTISDRFVGLGPFGAILSAFMHDPDTAWLVAASDQPFLDRTTIQELVSRRNPSKLATCFYNPETDFPEPLITLWEPRAYPIMLNYLGQGYSCPRKVLINSDIEMITLDDASVLKNVNTPEEYEEAVALLSQ